MSQIALILGGTGRFGRNATAAFAAAGWETRQFDRRHDDVMQAARGAQVIVNGWNPPYQDWAAQVPGLHAQVRRAAAATGATVILPGNLYVYGAGAPDILGPETPHRAENPLGRIRRDMEAAYRADGIRTIILRAGDYIDTEASGNWFDSVMTKGLARGRLTYPGNPDIPHAWGFLPDVARAAARLAAMRDALPRFTDVTFPGYTLSGRELAAALAQVTGHDVGVVPFRWWPLRLAQPFVPLVPHLFEMRYLWDMPHRLDGAAFDRLLPGFRHTPVSDALRAAVRPAAPALRPVMA